MSFLISVLFISAFVLALLTIYRLVYFNSISCVKLDNSGASIISCKPNKQFFNSLSQGRASSFVSLGSNYYVFCCDSSDSTFILNGISFSSDVYIFYRSFGRFKSLSLSDRCLIDIISKFKGV